MVTQDEIDMMCDDDDEELSTWSQVTDLYEVFQQGNKFGMFLLNYHFYYSEEEKQFYEERIKAASDYLTKHIDNMKRVKKDLSVEDLDYIEENEQKIELFNMLTVLMNPSNYKVAK